MYSYNGHAVVDGRISSSANEQHYQLKIVNPSYNSFACWSPAAAALTREFLNKRSAPVVPVLSLPSVASVPSADRPRVLHAGSFLGWAGFLPWVIETSDEYCDSILALDRAVSKELGVDLIVRAKRKSECAPEHLTKLLPARPGLTITDTATTPYHVAVQEADLLVSFMSTTIEEALMLRRPVLLWGGDKPLSALARADRATDTERSCGRLCRRP